MNSVKDDMLVSDLQTILNEKFGWKKCRVVFELEGLAAQDRVSKVLKKDDTVVAIPIGDGKVDLNRHVLKDQKAPTLEDIRLATQGKKEDETAEKKNEEVATEMSQRIHGFMSNLFGRNNAMLDDEEEDEEDMAAPEQVEGEELPIPEVSAESLEQLMGMGFSENAARKALILCHGRTEQAMDWILEHDGPTLNDAITQEQLRSVRGARGGGVAVRPVFQVDQNIANRLQEMGFSEQQVSDALRATRNNEEAAVSFLLGEGGGGGGGPEEDSDEEGGLPMNMLNNPVLRALLTHPGIQEGLRNPRVLEAFRAILIDPASASNYLNDPEVAPILLQVNNILQQAPENE